MLAPSFCVWRQTYEWLPTTRMCTHIIILYYRGMIIIYWEYALFSRTWTRRRRSACSRLIYIEMYKHNIWIYNIIHASVLYYCRPSRNAVRNCFEIDGKKTRRNAHKKVVLRKQWTERNRVRDLFFFLFCDSSWTLFIFVSPTIFLITNYNSHAYARHLYITLLLIIVKAVGVLFFN